MFQNTKSCEQNMLELLDKQKIIPLFYKHGVKVTRPRVAIYQIIKQNKHIKKSKIYKMLKKLGYSITRATFYNVLKVLEKHDLISSITINKFGTLYEVNTKRHAHFVCNNCKKVYDISFKQLNISYPQTILVNNDNEASIQKADIVLYGLCSSCNF